MIIPGGLSVEAKYVFASFLKEVKNAWKRGEAQENIIEAFYNAVVESGGLEEQLKDRIVVTRTYASLVFNRRPNGNVRKEILDHIDDELVKKNLPDILEKTIIKKKIRESNLEGLVHRLNDLIQDDEYISVEDREAAGRLANEGEHARFLMKAFILSLQPLNVPEREPVEANPAELSVDDDFAVLYEKMEKIGDKRILQRIDKPEIPVEKEAPYICELYKAYASYLRGAVQHKEDLPEELQEDFEERRDDYYAAETVHLQGVGITPELTGDEFARLKEETRSIVSRTNRKALMDQLNGFECMTRVMDKAETITSTSNLFSRAGYVGPVENRGICQMLAGEKKLHWVKENE